MNFIANIFSYIKDSLSYFYAPKDEIEDNEYTIIEPIINDTPIEPIYYFFINTANIYKASHLLLTRLNEYKGEKIKIYLLKSHTLEPYKGEKIKIYLLKSHTLEPLFRGTIVVNDNYIERIGNKLFKKRRHLRTYIDAIDSFVEYNNIKNYHIFY
jgi:hypothetical protein